MCDHFSFFLLQGAFIVVCGHFLHFLQGAFIAVCGHFSLFLRGAFIVGGVGSLFFFFFFFFFFCWLE